MTGDEMGNGRQAAERPAVPLQNGEAQARPAVEVRRARRTDLVPLAALVRDATRWRLEIDEGDVLDWLFSKGLWVAEVDGELVGVAGWQAENLLCVTDLFYIHPPQWLDSAGAALLSTIEAEANTLMCEANVVTLRAVAGDSVRACLSACGYEPKRYGELHRIWREVLDGFAVADHDLLVKRLRDRMIMVPI